MVDGCCQKKVRKEREGEESYRRVEGKTPEMCTVMYKGRDKRGREK